MLVLTGTTWREKRDRRFSLSFTIALLLKMSTNKRQFYAVLDRVLKTCPT